MLTQIPSIRPTRIIRSASVSSKPSTRRACSVIRASSSSKSNDENRENSLPQNVLSRRREFVLHSYALPVVLGVIFDVGSKAPAPKLGVQEFNGIKSLTLCPPGSVNCLSTAEEMGTCVSFFASSLVVATRCLSCVCVCAIFLLFLSFFSSRRESPTDFLFLALSFLSLFLLRSTSSVRSTVDVQPTRVRSRVETNANLRRSNRQRSIDRHHQDNGLRRFHRSNRRGIRRLRASDIHVSDFRLRRRRGVLVPQRRAIDGGVYVSLSNGERGRR